MSLLTPERRKVVVLNCPPRSGKDTIAIELHNNDHYQILSFKSKLIAIALLVSGVTIEEWNERYENRKDEPWDRLGGLSQRQYLIKISEDWIKPVHGKQYFGNVVAQQIIESNNSVVIPDGGFEEEIQPVAEELGSDLLILQWAREGCNFDNDSRDWITTFPDNTVRIEDNNGTVEEHYERAKQAIKEYYNEI